MLDVKTSVALIDNNICHACSELSVFASSPWVVSFQPAEPKSRQAVHIATHPCNNPFHFIAAVIVPLATFIMWSYSERSITMDGNQFHFLTLAENCFITFLAWRKVYIEQKGVKDGLGPLGTSKVVCHQAEPNEANMEKENCRQKYLSQSTGKIGYNRRFNNRDYKCWVPDHHL